jgi:hypothetical protein
LVGKTRHLFVSDIPATVFGCKQPHSGSPFVCKAVIFTVYRKKVNVAGISEIKNCIFVPYESVYVNIVAAQ